MKMELERGMGGLGIGREVLARVLQDVSETVLWM